MRDTNAIVTKDLQNLFNEYLYECQYSRRLRPETIRSYRVAFKHLVNLTPEINNIKSISASLINEFFYKLQTRKRFVGRNTEKVGVKDSTIRTYWNKFNPFFQWLITRGLLKENPLTKKPPWPLYEDRRALEREEIYKLIASINLHSSNVFLLKRDLLIIYILTFCGLRRTELISLQLQDIDLEKRILTVRGETSKSRRTRQIPMNYILCLACKEYFVELKKLDYKTPYLLVSYTYDMRLTVYGLRHWVEKLIEWSGVEFHLHRFRHTFASSLGKQNTSAIKIQKLLGHTDLRMTDRYLRSMCVEELRDDIDRMDIDNLI